MARKRSTDIRKRIKPATRWGVHVLMGVLLAVVMAGAVAQLLAAAPSPAPPDSAAAVSTASPTANAAGGSTAAGAASSARTLYVYGDQLQPLVEETDGVQTLNIYGPGGQIIAQVAPDGQGGQEVRYLLADHLGSTRVVLDGDGNVVARFEYGPYGDTTAAGTAAAEVRYRYTGHPWDEAQGVYETPARQYDPTLGRFLSVDPKRAGASPYMYAGNNPVGFLDPTGRAPRPFIVKSGLRGSSSHERGTKSLAEVLGAGPKERIQDATSVFGEPNVQLSIARDSAPEVLYEGSSKELKYNDKMYWLIGDEEPVKVPGDLKFGLENLRSLQEDFARGIVLIDISSTRDKWSTIGAALTDINVPHAVVFGDVKLELRFPTDKITQKSWNTTGMYTLTVESGLLQYTEFDPNQYKTYAEGIAEHVAGVPSRERPPIPGSVSISHTQDGLYSESGSNAGTGSLGVTLDSTPDTPSIQPVTQGGNVQPVGSSTVPMDIEHVSPFLPTAFMADD